ncbi:ABC transporter permease [Negadavirga shengliensis]|uniref:ABC transporter permease n=1 Tax=Negadavirga shengliensis TaxID=1389218 RepID=A0ABV9T3X7_9BACT
MWRNYLKIAWRNLKRNKGYSFINIAGLAIGMAVAMLIGLWIWDELSFNSSFDNRDRLAQVMLNQTYEGEVYTGSTIQMPLAEALLTGYASDFKAISLVSRNNNYILSVREKNLSGIGIWVQSDFPAMFTLKMLSGNYNALRDPSTILVSSSLSKALFGDEDPLNKSLRIDNKVDMVIGGVYEDFPYNSTFREAKMLLPWENEENWLNKQTDWTNHSGQLFVQMNEGSDFQVVSEKIKSIPTPHIDKWKEEIILHPMSKLYLYNEFENGMAVGGRIQFLWLFGTIGIAVLLLACINFMNLSTARSEKRSKEVGIRKAVGSARSQLIGQFLSEAVVVTGLSVVISLVLVRLSLPFFNVFAEKQIIISWNNPTFWLLLLAFTLFTGLISGSYPAFYLSAFKPVKILKGTFSAGRLATLPRKVLVVIQFTVSVTLIICTLIVFQQVQHAKNRMTGFTREGLITVGINTPELRKHVDVIKNDLIQKGLIENMALASQSPAHFGNNNSIDWSGKDPGLVVFFRNVGVTPDFGKTIGWDLKRGRDFSGDLPGDSTAIIINENAAAVMGFEDPLGEVVKFRGKEYTIIGVTADMLTQSPYEPGEPTFFTIDDWTGLIVMRLNATIPIRDALAGIDTVFKKFNPESPFDFSFVDSDYARKYANEERIGNLAGLFAILAVFISCLGLFGLASFVAEQRTKEIGIRKVLGASIAGLWKMLSRDFVMLTIIACLISIPLSFIFMNNWLMQYMYRITLTWEVFAAAALGAIVLTLLTVSFQAIKAALMNPVESLRSE